MKGTKSTLAVLALIAMITDFGVQAHPADRQKRQIDSSTFTVVDGFAFEGKVDGPQRRPPVTARPPATARTPVTARRPQTQQTPSPVGTTSTTESAFITQCKQNCRFRTTSEYNPLCGTDGTMYNNPGMLDCASSCGVAVARDYWGPCKSEIRID